MNGIFNDRTDNKLHGLLAPRNKESVETAGSLAMNVFHSLFEVNTYDEFTSSNPFAIDYSLYSDSAEIIAYDGFWSGITNAAATVTGDCSASFTGGGDCSGASCSGGFTSVC